MGSTAFGSRRAFLRRAAIGTALLGLPAAAPTLARAGSSPFSIVVLPDTQMYTAYNSPRNRPGIFESQTRWIVEQRDNENIVFVSHVGDVVNNGSAHSIEWERADSAMGRLHGRVPYAVVPGNHDLNRVGSRSSGVSAFVKRYGRGRYSGMSWYGGSSSNQVNHFQRFQAGSWTFLHLALDLEAPNSALEWAQQVINANRGLPTIVSTHSYQNDSSGRPSYSQFRGNAGETIWQKFIKPNPQIFVVVNGHFHKRDGERHQVSYNSRGLPVFEMQSNYQHYPDGGQGYLRIIRVDPSASSISVRSYSPWLNRFVTDGDSRFSFKADLNRRFTQR